MPRASALPSPASTAALVRRRSPVRPRLALVLGSGFGGVAGAVTAASRFAFRDLPGFPVGRVPGHAGELILGEWQGIPVAVLAGRAHHYEGFDFAEIGHPVRVLAALGVETLLLTNAAGGIHPRLLPGTFMAIADHINFMGTNPLRGPVPPGRERFVDLSAVYDAGLRSALKGAAKDCGVPLREGVYLAVPGPSFETPAEIRAFRTLGADAVGMSTVPEAIVARQCGLRVAGLSCITNAAAGLGDGTVSHAEVLEMARTVSDRATALVGGFVRRHGGLAWPGMASRCSVPQ
ncbi:MAG: purine-nucleoside phosphorylase [Verrucomicrobia bacterium]|nr:MAG: purine-nucleoside phosphorylase [Verrucomicrobiota bacterium]